MAGTQVDGIALGCIAAGGVLAYAGIRGKSVPSLITGFIQGKPPAAASSANPVTGSSSSSSSSGGGHGHAVSGGSNEATLKATAATFGWTGAEWDALNNVEVAEGGYDLKAENAATGAYGMAQFIDGPSEYYQYGGNPDTAEGQSVAMCNYIEQRYQTPSAAWAHEQQYQWY